MAPKSLGAWPWCSPSAAQAYRPHLEGKARFPVSGCGVAAEGGNGRGKTGTKDENHVVYTKLASLMAHIKESACQCKRHRFDPWVWKIAWRRKWQPTLLFLPEKSHGQRSLMGYSP